MPRPYKLSPFHSSNGCVKPRHHPIDSSPLIPHTKTTSRLWVRPQRRRNRDSEGPQGLSEFFVLIALLVPANRRYTLWCIGARERAEDKKQAGPYRPGLPPYRFKPSAFDSD